MESTDNTTSTGNNTHHRLALWSLMLGNFVIGVGVLAPAGLLIQLQNAFSVDIATVSSLIGYGAAVLCIEAPLFAFLTNKIDRRYLLTGSLMLFALGHLVSALATNFATLLFVRLIMVAGAAIFTPQAASAIGLFIPASRRMGGVTFIFLGWSLASAVGIPLISLIGARLSWSAAYTIMGVASALAAIAVFVTVPRALRSPPLSIAAWKNVLGNRKILLVLAVTAISLCGQFTAYPFIAPELQSRLGASAELIAGLFAVYGIAGVIGAILSTTAIDKLGAPLTASGFIAAIAIGLVLWTLGTHAMLLTVMGLFIWGAGVGPANSAQQARLIAADPLVSSASVALNTSAIYIGQAVGTRLGAEMLVQGYGSLIGQVAIGLVSIALVASLTARYRFRT